MVLRWTKDICACEQTPVEKNPACKRGQLRGRQENEDREEGLQYKQ